MTQFLGINNVIDAEPILGKDGVADGFKVYYLVDKTVRVGKREFTEQRECMKTVWIREFDYESVGNDGSYHGFGRGTQFLRLTTAEREARKNKKKTQKKSSKPTAINLSVLNRILAGKK